MNINMPEDPEFNNYYRKHQKCLKLNGFQPKTIEAYSRAIRRIGNYFDCRIDDLTSDQLLDYFNELLDSHSWSAVKLDLYGLKNFWTVHKHPHFLFPSRKRGLKNAYLVDQPLDRGGIQTAMKAVIRQLGIKKKFHAIPCATAMQRICWKQGLISLNYNRSWAMSVS